MCAIRRDGRRHQLGGHDSGGDGQCRNDGLQLAIAEAAENSDHLILLEDAMRTAMARQ